MNAMKLMTRSGANEVTQEFDRISHELIKAEVDRLRDQLKSEEAEDFRKGLKAGHDIAAQFSVELA